jgi:hypothetical protein
MFWIHHQGLPQGLLAFTSSGVFFVPVMLIILHAGSELACAATLRLKQFFPFTLIDAMGTLEETRQQITNELR